MYGKTEPLAMMRILRMCMFLGCAVKIGACGGPPPPKQVPASQPREPETGPEGLSPEVQAYLVALHKQFHPRWTEFLEALKLPTHQWHTDPNLEALVAITLNPTGGLVGAWLVHGSSVAAFDLRAVEVVLESSPFPPPPAIMRSDDGFVRIVWRFGRGAEPCGPMGALVHRERWELARLLPLFAAQRRYEDARIRIDEALRTGEAGPEVARAYARALLWAFLHDPDRELRTIAALGLAPTGDPEAHEIVRHLLSSDSAEALRAVRALSRMADAEDVEELLKLVARNDGVASVEAVPVLVRLGQTKAVLRILEPRILGSDPFVRSRALRALVKLDSTSRIPLLIQVAERKDVELEGRMLAIEGLAMTHNEEAARVLGKLLKDSNEQIRGHALVALARTGKLRIKAQMMAREWLRAESPQLRAAGTIALIRVGDGPHEWRGRLLDNLRAVDTKMALYAVDFLRHVGGGDAMRLLAALAEQGHPKVRPHAQAAYEELSGSRQPESDGGRGRGKAFSSQDRKQLVLALENPDRGTACAAAQGLSSIGLDVEAARRFIVRLNSGSPSTMATLAAAFLAGSRFECPPAEPTREGGKMLSGKGGEG